MRKSRSEQALAFLAKVATRFSGLALGNRKFLGDVLRVLDEEVGLDSCLVAFASDQGAGHQIVEAASGLVAGYVGKPLPRLRDVNDQVLRPAGDAIVMGDGPRDPRLRSCVSAPLVVRDHAIGVLSAYRAEAQAFSDQDLHLIVVIARYLSSAIELKRLYEDQAVPSGAGPGNAVLAPLPFAAALERECRRAERYRYSLAVLCLELNVVRAEHAHEVVEALARLLSGMCRDSDVAARSDSGFLLLLLHTTKRAAVSVAERIRQRVRAIAEDNGATGVKFGIGIAGMPEDGATADALLSAAKEAAGTAGARRAARM